MNVRHNWIDVGRSAFRKLNHIIDGFTNLFLDGLDKLPPAERELYEARYALCAGCALREKNKCSKLRSIQHVVTGEWVSGCGCNLAASTKAPDYECPAGKWGSVAHLLPTS